MHSNWSMWPRHQSVSTDWIVISDFIIIWYIVIKILFLHVVLGFYSRVRSDT